MRYFIRTFLVYLSYSPRNPLCTKRILQGTKRSQRFAFNPRALFCMLVDMRKSYIWQARFSHRENLIMPDMSYAGSGCRLAVSTNVLHRCRLFSIFKYHNKCRQAACHLCGQVVKAHASDISCILTDQEPRRNCGTTMTILHKALPSQGQLSQCAL